jgi:hypothetical protein
LHFEICRYWLRKNCATGHDRLILIVKCCEMNVEKAKVMGIAAHPPPVQNMVLSKPTGHCGIYQLFG